MQLRRARVLLRVSLPSATTYFAIAAHADSEPLFMLCKRRVCVSSHKKRPLHTAGRAKNAPRRHSSSPLSESAPRSQLVEQNIFIDSPATYNGRDAAGRRRIPLECQWVP